MLRLLTVTLAVLCAGTANALVTSKEVARFSAAEAHQAVAVDEAHFYAIANSAIGKYDKRTGARVDGWSLPDGPIQHMNAGIVYDGVLYATNSNYPDVPMASSLEMFDTATMNHIGSHSFGIYAGSALWVHRKDDHWYVAFGHYDERGGTPGRDHTWSQLVKFDSNWRRVGGWTYPPEALARFKPQTNSGAAWGEDDLIYATAHHNHELYVLRLPKMGPAMEFIGVIPDTSYGQGIAWDPTEARTLYSIQRKTKEVIVYEVPPLPAR